MQPAQRPGWEFSDLWDAAVRRHASSTILVFEASDGSTSSYRYADFDHVVRATTVGLRRRGVGPGDLVHLVLPNSVAFLALWLACARIGAAFSSADPRATGSELAHLRERLRPVLAVVGSEQEAAYRDGALDGVDVVVTAAEDSTVGGLGVPFGADDAPDDRRCDGRLAVLFTSGTTSAPKGVVLTQATYAHTAQIMAAAAELGPTDRWLVTLPLFHANAQYYCVAAAIAVGASVALMSGFSATRYLDQAARHAVTHASLFATPMRMVLARGGERALPVPLRHMWFAQNLTAAEYERFAGLVGCRPRQLYGMTETGPAVLSAPLGAADPTVMGRVTPGCHVRLTELDGPGPAAPGAVGEIQVGGVPGRELFAGYLGDPEATRARWAEQGPDGWAWFATGDRARRDPDGSYRFAGRDGDQIKVAGENVSVVEVEQAIAEVPGVFEVAVVGRTDSLRSEVPVAYVVPADGPPGDLVRRIEAHCASTLSPAKRPHEIHLVTALPRTSVGKVRKFLLSTGASLPASPYSDRHDEELLT